MILYNNISLLNNTKKGNWIMFGFLGVIFAISPFITFFLFLFCFRQKGSLVVFVLFSFYFGWFYEPQLDLLNHYNHFKTLVGKSLFDAWTNPGTIHMGKEPYPVLFKYVVGKISASSNFFSACACMAYTIIFVYGVLGSVRDLYVQKMSLPAWVAFLGIIFTVEYNWFLGFRYWTGAFVFIAFYIRYIRTYEKKYLYLSFLCVCFHFSLIALCVATLLNHILKNNFKIRYILVIIAWVVRYLEIPFTTMIAKLDIMKGIVKDASRNESIIRSVAGRMEFIRSEGNWYYLIRNDVLFMGAVFFVFFFWKSDKSRFFQFNTTLLGLFLIIYAFANFGYMDLTFYDRFYKVAVILLYMYVYIYLMRVQKEIDRRNQLNVFLFSIIFVLYAIATIVVSQRQFLWNLDLWFSNFFMNTNT